MVIYDFKYQIASIMVILILLINYLKNKKLPLLSTKCFFVFLVTSIINLIADMATVYALNNYWRISGGLLRLYHQIFVGSLNLLAFSLYLYVCFLDNGQKRFKFKDLLPRVLPLLFAVCMVVFAPIYYHVSYGVYYSYGPMPNTVYVSAAVYVTLILIQVNRKSCHLSVDTRRSINLGVFIWIGVAGYQMFNPTALMSSLGNMLMVLFIYLSFENPKEYLDVATGTLNRRAFHLVTEELTEGKKEFFMVNILLKDMEYLQNILGHAGVYDVLKTMADYIETITGERIYHSRSKILSLLFTNREKASNFIEKFSKWEFEYRAKDIEMYPKYIAFVLEIPRYAKTCDEINDILDYVRVDYINENEESNILYINDSFIKQFQYYEDIVRVLEDAIQNDGFKVFYQPIYDVKIKSFTSAEALVRLKDTKTLGFISPELFIPIAEKKGMIKELGRTVFEKVCQFAQTNQLEHKGVHYIEVNLSGIQGTDKDIVKQLKECMDKFNISPSFMNLEITETAAIEAGDKLKNNMKKLSELGCGFSLDDFGTGYSNLAKMADGNYDVIKLDKSLLWPCFEEGGEEARVILSNSINMILQLGMKIVAEGVETKEQVELLSNQGVNYLQGYYFSKPINGEQYIEYLKKNNSLH